MPLLPDFEAIMGLPSHSPHIIVPHFLQKYFWKSRRVSVVECIFVSSFSLTKFHKTLKLLKNGQVRSPQMAKRKTYVVAGVSQSEPQKLMFS